MQNERRKDPASSRSALAQAERIHAELQEARRWRLVRAGSRMIGWSSACLFACLLWAMISWAAGYPAAAGWAGILGLAFLAPIFGGAIIAARHRPGPARARAQAAGQDPGHVIRVRMPRGFKAGDLVDVDVRAGTIRLAGDDPLPEELREVEITAYRAP